VAELVEAADVVVENYLESQVRSLHIDELRSRNPNCVWVSITPATTVDRSPTSRPLTCWPKLVRV